MTFPVCNSESAKSMATPQGMSRGSRDLGPRLEGAQEGVQGSVPPGFTYTQIESMVRELRTAAALEVNVKHSIIPSFVHSFNPSFLHSFNMCPSPKCQICKVLSTRSSMHMLMRSMTSVQVSMAAGHLNSN